LISSAEKLASQIFLAFAAALIQRYAIRTGTAARP
jgi:hypothetical protein